MTDELVAFIRARLDDDEQVAQRVRAETEGTWAWTYRNVHAVKTDGTTEHIATTDTGAQAVYFGLWNPDRVLAEVDAKRRILAEYERYAADRRRAMNGWESSREISPILAALALPYADLPGYRQEWEPQ